jgi:plasmid maintenance system antidote protein VapI
MVEPAEHDWYAREWLRYLKKKQAHLAEAVGWDRGRASKIINSKQPYTRENIAVVAAWLGIEPYELLMRPADAMDLRALRETARRIAGLDGGKGD